MDHDSALGEFRDYLIDRGLALRTVDQYCRCLDAALAWAVESGVDLLEATPWQARKLRMAVASRSGYSSHLRAVLGHYFEMNGVAGPGPDWDRRNRYTVSEDNRIQLEAFTDELVGRSLAESTVRNYRMRLKAAMAWAEDNELDLLDLSPRDVARLAETVPGSNASRRHLRTALKYFWQMCGVEGPVMAVRVPPRPQMRWKGLEDDQVEALLEVARGDWPRGGVIYLGLYLGLRREEIASLRWSDFDEDLKWVRIVGKGDRTRHLPVHPVLQRVLNGARWPGEYVFPGRLGGHISLTTINNWVAQMGEQAGIGHLHPHQLRHTAGAKVNDETRDIYAAQGWLGHAQVETTRTYTRLTQDRLVAAMATFDGWEPRPDEHPDGDGNVIPLRRSKGDAS